MSSRQLFHRDDVSAMLPEALDALADVRARGQAHRYVRHVRSSQAFALNLFAPLDGQGVRGVVARLGYTVEHTDTPIFEYEDQQDRLREASRRSPHRTQVDVLLAGTTDAGRRIAALIEVKFSETNFGTCSAYASPDNSDRDVCTQPGLFGSDPDRCFQLRNHGYGHRRYGDYLGGVPVTPPPARDDSGGCWVRTGRSQPMRNLALAHALVKDGEYDEAVFALCSLLGHESMSRRFREFTSVFGDADTVTIRYLPAESVARLHRDGGTTLAGHYSDVLNDRALVHLSADGTQLHGTWVLRGGELDCDYRHGDDGAREYAEAVLTGSDWETAVDQVPGRPPYNAWWEAVDCSFLESAHDVFHRITDC